MLAYIAGTGQLIHLDANGQPYLVDGFQVHKGTLSALIRRHLVEPEATDLLGDKTCIYRINQEQQKDRAR